MFFFPMFWTVYIPIVVAVLSLALEWLVRSLRELGQAAGKSRAVAVTASGTVNAVTRELSSRATLSPGTRVR
jgi:phosphatidylglycerophosphate synthase